MVLPKRSLVLLLTIGSSACGGWGGGSKWVQQPLDDDQPPAGPPAGELEEPTSTGPRPVARTLGGVPPNMGPNMRPKMGAEVKADPRDRTGGGGRVLGTFRNTYYDFPAEADFAGPTVSLMNGGCQSIAKVARGFYEAVCVQGSGSLTSGGTVSFAKRDCPCAEVCPRTGQKICFDALDKASFPWGRGAAGTPITPLRTLAADTAVLPMGTVVYIPELDGAPRGEEGDVVDGCFVVEDRGLRVKGEHVDIFTGVAAQTSLLNERVPSNQGVTVVVDAPRCARLTSHGR